MTDKPMVSVDCRDPEIERLIEVIEQALSGTYHKDFEAFTRSSHSEPIRRITEIKEGGMAERHA